MNTQKDEETININEELSEEEFSTSENVYNEESSANKLESNEKSSISADLIRGHINTIILRSLYERDKYGYEIMNDIGQKSHGQYELKQPTLYSALKRLENQGYIKAYWKTDEVTSGGRRKYFTLTDAGREMTEKNQAEWEYSRSIIDSLISTKEYDFTQPPPAPLDFSLLKKSVTRVPDLETSTDDSVKSEITGSKTTEEKIPETTSIEIIENSTTDTTTLLTTEKTEPATVVSTPLLSDDEATIKDSATEGDNTPTVAQLFRAQVGMPEVQSSSITEEELQRRRTHENYLRLMSQGAQPKPEKKDTVSIYTNLPATERDYRNLINNLYQNTVQQNRQYPTTNTAPIEAPNPYNNLNQSYQDVYHMANKDGLKITTSTKPSNPHSTAKTIYPKRSGILTATMATFAYLMVIIILLFVFQNKLKISIVYPFVLLVGNVIQLIIGISLYSIEFGNNARRPAHANYIITSTVLTILACLIIAIFAILLQVNFTNIKDIVIKMIVPLLTALSIMVYSLTYYIKTK